MAIKVPYLTIFLFFNSVFVFAQTGNINGVVRTSDGQPAEFVSLSVKSTSKGTLTDKSGNYLIKGIKPGIHTLIAYYLGLEKQEQIVEVKSGESTTVEFTLRENSAQLQEVIISTNREKISVAKMPLKDLENPQVYSTVSSEITLALQGRRHVLHAGLRK